MNKLFKEQFSYKDSQCTIICDRKEGIETAKQSLKNHYTQLENYIQKHPIFEHTLKPTTTPEEPLVAKLMAQAAQKAQVGPMAAVAGVLADLAAADMTTAGCKVAVVEDGGEIAVISDIPIDVAVGFGDEPLSRRFGFRLTEFPVAVATSSGCFSRAFSFGDAEAATVFCKNAGLADAAATAVANTIKGDDINAAIARGIKTAKTIQGVEGALIVYKGTVGTWGKIPEIIKINPNSIKHENTKNRGA
ncbi:MAG: UPF0280 family protein [Candidatus Bathyarchaeota archaeon]|nr:UPF0280 family protein [Candidatus Bathyarchaeota archaeon]